MRASSQAASIVLDSSDAADKTVGSTTIMTIGVWQLMTTPDAFVVSIGHASIGPLRAFRKAELISWKPTA